MGMIKAISISNRKGVRKENIASTKLLPGFGLDGDAHGGKWHRQVSFLAEESIETMRNKGLDVVAGNFAENITTEGVDLASLAVGTHITIGESELIISQLGKICHTRCAIYHQAGDCVMPREGIFAVVEKGGEIKVGDKLAVLSKRSEATAIVTTKEAEKNQGEKLEQLVIEKFASNNSTKPAFIRFDTITTKEGGSFEAILKDLAETQKISTIIVFDPTGTLGLTLAGLSTIEGKTNTYQKEGSTINYYRTLAEIDQ